jgi:hypothetical protein
MILYLTIIYEQNFKHFKNCYELFLYDDPNIFLHARK